MSLPGAARAAAADLKRLLSLEAALVLEGVKRQARGRAVDVALIASGAILLLFALLFLLATAAAGLAVVVPTWAALLIVGAATAAIAAALIGVAVSRIRSAGPPVPAETRRKIAEDARWVREKTS